MVRKTEEMDSGQKTVVLLQELLKWIKITSLPQVKKILEELLPNEEKKIAYQYSDGRGSQEISELAGVGTATVSRWWASWINSGIAEPMGVKGGTRAKRSFSLEDFGIDVPTPKAIKTDKQEETSSLVTEGQKEEEKDE